MFFLPALFHSQLSWNSILKFQPYNFIYVKSSRKKMEVKRSQVGKSSFLKGGLGKELRKVVLIYFLYFFSFPSGFVYCIFA